MGFMENRLPPIQGHAYTRATPFSHFSPQRDEERLNVSPLDVGAHWILEDCFEGPSLLLIHQNLAPLLVEGCRDNSIT